MKIHKNVNINIYKYIHTYIYINTYINAYTYKLYIQIHILKQDI